MGVSVAPGSTSTSREGGICRTKLGCTCSCTSVLTHTRARAHAHTRPRTRARAHTVPSFLHLCWLIARLRMVSFRPIVYWVFAGSCIAYSCCSLANSVLPASVVSAYTCLQPVVGVLFSWILNGEALAWRDLGGVLIIAGLLLTSLGARDDGDGDGDQDRKFFAAGVSDADDGESSASLFRLPTTLPLSSTHSRTDADASARGQLQGPLLPKTQTDTYRQSMTMSGDL